MNFFILGSQRFVWCPKWTPASSSSFIAIWLMLTSLPLGELEPGPGAALTVLLPFLHARVACEEAGLLEGPPQLYIEETQGACDPVADRPRLTGATAAVDNRDHVEFLGRLGQLKGLPDHHLQDVVRKVFVERPVVHEERPVTRAQEHAGHRLLAAPDRVVLKIRQGSVSPVVRVVDFVMA